MLSVPLGPPSVRFLSEILVACVGADDGAVGDCDEGEAVGAVGADVLDVGNDVGIDVGVGEGASRA